MGHLSALSIATRSVKLPNSEETLTVRGLCAADVAALTNAHLPAITQIVAAVRTEFEAAASDSESSGLDMAQLSTTIKTAMQIAPEMVAHLLLLANDDPDPEAGMVNAARLPIMVQTGALLDIFELSMQSEAEVKKLIEMLSNTMEGLEHFILGLRQASSLDGNGASGGE